MKEKRGVFLVLTFLFLVLIATTKTHAAADYTPSEELLTKEFFSIACQDQDWCEVDNYVSQCHYAYYSKSFEADTSPKKVEERIDGTYLIEFAIKIDDTFREPYADAGGEETCGFRHNIRVNQRPDTQGCWILASSELDGDDQCSSALVREGFVVPHGNPGNDGVGDLNAGVCEEPLGYKNIKYPQTYDEDGDTPAENSMNMLLQTYWIEQPYAMVCANAAWTRCDVSQANKVVRSGDGSVWKCTVVQGAGPNWQLQGIDKDSDSYLANSASSPDCRDDPSSDPPECSDLNDVAQCSDAKYAVCSKCINPGAAEICGDVVGDSSSQDPTQGLGNDCKVQTSNDCNENRNACESVNNPTKEKLSFIETAEGGSCCGLDAKQGDIKQGILGTPGSYICLNKEVGYGKKDAASTPPGWNCEGDWCFVSATSAPLNILTVNKLPETYDVVSNGKEWFECREEKPTDIAFDITKFSTSALGVEPAKANSFTCYKEGNHWSFAQCGDISDNNVDNGVKVRGEGDGEYKLSFADEDKVKDRIEILAGTDLYKKYYGQNPSFDFTSYTNIEFMVKLQPALGQQEIRYPAGVEISFVGPTGEYYKSGNVLASTTNTPLLLKDRYLHVRYPIAPLLNVKAIRISSLDARNQIQVRNVFLSKAGSNSLCSGDSVTTPGKSNWLSDLDYNDPASNLDGREICEKLYKADGTAGTHSPWLGSEQRIGSIPSLCCGDDSNEYYAGESENGNACWNSEVVKEGERIMNVQVEVASQEETIAVVAPPSFSFSYSISSQMNTFQCMGRTRPESCLDYIGDEGMRGQRVICSDGAFCDHAVQYDGARSSSPSIVRVCHIYQNTCEGISSSTCSYKYRIASVEDFDSSRIQDEGYIEQFAQNGPEQIKAGISCTQDERSQIHPDYKDISKTLNPLSVFPIKVGEAILNKVPGVASFSYTLEKTSDNQNLELFFADPIDSSKLPANTKTLTQDMFTSSSYTVDIMAFLATQAQLDVQKTPLPNTPHILNFACTKSECIYPLPGSAPYTITNSNPLLYDLYFIDDKSKETLITQPNQQFQSKGNIKARNVPLQVIYSNEVDPQGNPITKFYGCSAADVVSVGAAAPYFENIAHCSVKEEMVCSPSSLYEGKLSINQWSDLGISNVGYKEANVFSDEDVQLKLKVLDQVKDAKDLNQSTIVLPTRNILPNPIFAVLGGKLSGWTLLENNVAIESSAQFFSQIREEAFTLLAGQTLQSEKIPVKPGMVFSCGAEEQSCGCSARVVDENGRLIVEYPAQTPLQFDTGDATQKAAYVQVIFQGSCTIKHPSLQLVDGTLPAVSYAQDELLATEYPSQTYPRSASACCPQNYCWNGYACAEPMSEATFLAEKTEDDRFYRCIAGDWKRQTPKTDWRYEEIGFCPQETQCFVYKTGQQVASNTPLATFLAQGAMYPTCVNNGEFVLDHYCSDGSWSSRTKFLAAQLLETLESQSPQDYTLYCTTPQEALPSMSDRTLPFVVGNTIRPQRASPTSGETTTRICFDKSDLVWNNLVPTNDNTCINNVCLIKYGDGKVALATTINKELSDQNSFLYALGEQAFDPARCIGNEDFKKCTTTLPGDLYYNDQLKALIYAKDGLDLSPGLLQRFWQSLRQTIRQIFSSSSQASVSSSQTLSEAKDVRQLYFLEKDERKIRAILESQGKERVLISEYEGFQTDVCAYANAEQINQTELHSSFALLSGQTPLQCTKVDDIFHVEARLPSDHSTSFEFLWPQLTGKLRVN